MFVNQSRSQQSTISPETMKSAIRRMNEPGYKLTEDDARLQLGLLFDYLEYSEQARFLSDFVNGIGYDNRKTKTIIENRIQQARWNKVTDRTVPALFQIPVVPFYPVTGRMVQTY